MINAQSNTACSQSVILSSTLPFCDQPAWGYASTLCLVEMGYVLRPVHSVHVKSKLITGFFVESGLADHRYAAENHCQFRCKIPST